MDFRGIGEAVLQQDGNIRLGMLDENNELIFDSIDEDLLVLTKYGESGSAENCVYLQPVRVNEDYQWIYILADLGNQTMQQVLWEARWRIVTTFGVGCLMENSGAFAISTPIEYSSPAFVAELALKLLDDGNQFLFGKPEGAQVRPAVTGQALDSNLSAIRSWLDNAEFSSVDIRSIGSALLLEYRAVGLSLGTFSYESDEGETMHRFSPKVSNLYSNPFFRDSGLGLAVQYSDMSLSPQIALPIDKATPEGVVNLARFLRTAFDSTTGHSTPAESTDMAEWQSFLQSLGKEDK